MPFREWLVLSYLVFEGQDNVEVGIKGDLTALVLHCNSNIGMAVTDSTVMRQMEP